MTGIALTHIGSTIHVHVHSLLGASLHDLVLAIQHLFSAVF